MSDGKQKSTSLEKALLLEDAISDLPPVCVWIFCWYLSSFTVEHIVFAHFLIDFMC